MASSTASGHIRSRYHVQRVRSKVTVRRQVAVSHADTLDQCSFNVVSKSKTVDQSVSCLLRIGFAQTLQVMETPMLMPSNKAQNICIIFVQCWTNVEDVGPTLYKFYTNVLCLLGADPHAKTNNSNCLFEKYIAVID